MLLLSFLVSKQNAASSFTIFFGSVKSSLSSDSIPAKVSAKSRSCIGTMSTCKKHYYSQYSQYSCRRNHRHRILKASSVRKLPPQCNTYMVAMHLGKVVGPRSHAPSLGTQPVQQNAIPRTVGKRPSSHACDWDTDLAPRRNIRQCNLYHCSSWARGDGDLKGKWTQMDKRGFQ